MNLQGIKKLLSQGESLTVEFKAAKDTLSNSVFETVCSFSNRYGGYLFLGVSDSGEALGVNPKAIPALKKNFVNMLNNPEKVSPVLYLNLEEITINGKTILYVYIPISSHVELCSGKIFDRTEDADIDITKSVDLVANLFNRKSMTFTERKLFPYVTKKELRPEIIKRARQMALNKTTDHPWEHIPDMELFKSAGLYEENWVTNEKGFNLAAVLLFGRDEVIRSCVPGYITDAILRKENLDRYDDRLMVETNLIDSFGLLMEFVAKHTLDRFFLVDNKNVSVRSWIAREIISNSLVHREYASVFPAKIVIEKDRLYAENWNKSLKPGRITPEDFTPYPKNPILARFFVNIGLADQLGSGVRNLYKYTKIYSGSEPELLEGDIFKTTVLLTAGDKGSDKGSDKLSPAEENFMESILPYLNEKGQIDAKTAGDITGKSAARIKQIFAKLTETGILEKLGANKNRTYQLVKK
ncbi:ATP-dependent DNA helicase RecG [Spirochaetia bacterium]|nr:ATP-dependent DNA helicase RecG [Spirochaetia bacterium]